MADDSSARDSVTERERSWSGVGIVQKYRLMLHEHGLDPHGLDTCPSLAVLKERVESIGWFMSVLTGLGGHVPAPDGLGHCHFVHARRELQRTESDKRLVEARLRAMAWLYDAGQDIVLDQPLEVKGVM